MLEKSVELTKKYIGDQTLEAFANSLGINATRQNVWLWKEGKHVPDVQTLFSVLASPDATSAAKTWAGEILSLYTARAEAQAPIPAEKNGNEKGC